MKEINLFDLKEEKQNCLVVKIIIITNSMNTVKELQHSLSQLIYSITDIKSLSEIKSIIDHFIKPIENKKDDLPWEKAILSMKTITSFKEVVKNQGNKKLTFEELYPCIDDSESTYSVDDLLAALN